MRRPDGQEDGRERGRRRTEEGKVKESDFFPLLFYSRQLENTKEGNKKRKEIKKKARERESE